MSSSISKANTSVLSFLRKINKTEHNYSVQYYIELKVLLLDM